MSTGPEQDSPQDQPSTPSESRESSTSGTPSKPSASSSSSTSSSAPPASGQAVTAVGPAGTPGLDGPVPPLIHKTPWTAYIKPVLWTLVAIYVIAFVFLNRDSVNINFIVFKASVPMIFVLAGMTLIGAGLCVGVMVATRRRSTRKAELAALKAASEPGEE
jgi:uncharacterized integral membrane protein